nr:MAG TPA: hypothetical protein [Caudoviricetes sp.]
MSAGPSLFCFYAGPRRVVFPSWGPGDIWLGAKAG